MSTQRFIAIAEPDHQQTQQETQQVPTTGGISYQERGPADGTPMLFLHGLGGGAGQFAAQLAFFGGAGFRALAWDMPGYGGSAPLPLVSMDALAAALVAFIAALRLDRPILVGHSLGGMVLLQYLAHALPGSRPGGSRAVVLSQTSAIFGAKDPAWAAEFIQSRLAPLDAGQTLQALAPGLVAAMVGDEADQAGLALAAEIMGRTPASSYRDSLRAMLDFDQRGVLPHITIPVLVLSGARDQNAPPAGMQRMAARIPGARYAEMASTGHLAHLERPDAFNRIVMEFLPRLRLD